MKYPIILDVDTGEDDALAILFAVGQQLPLVCIITSYGNSSLSNATRNTCGILDMIGCTDIPVIAGVEKPMGKVNTFNLIDDDFLGSDGLCGLNLSTIEYPSLLEDTNKDGIDLLADLIQAQPGKVDYIISGPLTNFALLCTRYKSLVLDKINAVYSMGGAIFGPGNSGQIDPNTGKGYAEFNFYCDPTAVKIVLGSGINLHLISWDVTAHVCIGYNEIEQFRDDGISNSFCKKLFECFFKNYGLQHDRSFELNDVLTLLAYMGYGIYEILSIDIITDGPQIGRSILGENGYTIKYFTTQDIPILKEKVLEGLRLQRH